MREQKGGYCCQPVRRHDVCSVYPNVACLRRGERRKNASDVAAKRLGPVEAYLTVREVLSEATTVRPEPFGSELKAELLTAVGSRKWCAIAGAQRFLPVQVGNIRAYLKTRLVIGHKPF